MPLHRRRRDPNDLRRLLHARPSEGTQFHDARLLLVERRQLQEGLVQGEQIKLARSDRGEPPRAVATVRSRASHYGHAASQTHELSWAAIGTSAPGFVVNVGAGFDIGTRGAGLVFKSRLEQRVSSKAAASGNFAPTVV